MNRLGNTQKRSITPRIMNENKDLDFKTETTPNILTQYPMIIA